MRTVIVRSRTGVRSRSSRAGLTPRKFAVEYHEIADLRKEAELPDDFDLVALSTFTAQLKEAWRIAEIVLANPARYGY